MDLLTQLLAAMDTTANVKPRPVTIPGWPQVYVRGLTLEEADIDEEDLENQKKNKTRLARGVARLICDANGQRLMNPDNPEHIAKLKKQPWDLLRTLLATPDEGEKKGN